ncbi:MAG: glycerophosphodiester phosphodiesterase family protein [Pseudomonadota bacterium]
MFWLRVPFFGKLFFFAFASALISAAAPTSHAQSETAMRLDPRPQKIFAVGHRGAPSHAPENTLASHDAAIALGARVVEFDVRYTKDGHFVVIHDGTVNRTTNGRGRVSRMTLAEIKALDAGSWKGEQFAGLRVPTLREALRNIKGRAAVDIDFKGGPSNSGELLADILDEEGFRGGPMVTVFARSWDYKKLTGILGKYQLRPHYQNKAHTERVAREDRIQVMGLRRRGFSFRAAQNIRDNDVVLFTNVMGFADGPRGFSDSIEAGARFIQTDHLDRLAPYLAERGLLETCIPAHDFTCWTAPESEQQLAFLTSSVGDGQ